jgi:hypothetical protein
MTIVNFEQKYNTSLTIMDKGYLLESKIIIAVVSLILAPRVTEWIQKTGTTFISPSFIFLILCH